MIFTQYCKQKNVNHKNESNDNHESNASSKGI